MEWLAVITTTVRLFTDVICEPVSARDTVGCSNVNLELELRYNASMAQLWHRDDRGNVSVVSGDLFGQIRRHLRFFHGYWKVSAT